MTDLLTACERDQDGSGLVLLLVGHPARKLSTNLYDIYHYCVYSEKLLMMDRGTVRNIFFDVLLTVRLSEFISVINQLDAQNFCFTMSLLHASTCFEHMCCLMQF